MDTTFTIRIDDQPDPSLGYYDWIEELDRMVARRTELTLRELPAMRYRAAYTAGVAPDEFFWDEVADHLTTLGWDSEAE